jgi:hypothetical protein
MAFRLPKLRLLARIMPFPFDVMKRTIDAVDLDRLSLPEDFFRRAPQLCLVPTKPHVSL